MIEGVLLNQLFSLAKKLFESIQSDNREKRKWELYQGFLVNQKKASGVFFWNPDFQSESDEYKLLMELVKEGFLYFNPNYGFTIIKI